MPKLYLIPTALDESWLLAPQEVVSHIRYFIVEKAKTARASLKMLIPSIDLRACYFIEVNEHTDENAWKEEIEAIKTHDIGLLSEAGMPCVADPGSGVVLWAHRHGYHVIPLAGPNAIVMALAASGLNGQKFIFHGYLPKSLDQRVSLIKTYERDSSKNNCTQIFIEVPHHNNSLFHDLITHTQADTLITVASGLTSLKETIRTQTAGAWRSTSGLDWNKIPTVFLFLAR